MALDTAMTAITEMDGLYDRSHMDAESMSDQESFVSARDVSLLLSAVVVLYFYVPDVNHLYPRDMTYLWRVTK